MTTPNKHNQNPVSILSSYNSGQGNTSELSKQVKFVNDSFTFKDCAPVLLSENILKALFARNFYREFKNSHNPQAVLDAYALDYIGTDHERNSNKAIKKNPLHPVAKVLLAVDYKRNCIHAGLDNSSTDRVETLIDRIDAIEAKTTKAQLESLLNDFKAVFMSSEQVENHSNIVENERKDALKFQGLTDAHFINIQRSGTFIAAHISLDKASDGLVKLIELGFTLVSNNVDTETMLMQVQFNEENETNDL